MTEAEEVEVEQSSPNKHESISNDPAAGAVIVTGGEKPAEDKEEVDKEFEGGKDEKEEGKDDGEEMKEEDGVDGEKPTEDKEEVDMEIERGKGGEEEGKDDNEETEEDDGDDKAEKKLQQSVVNVLNDCSKELDVEVLPENNSGENLNYPVDAVENSGNAQTGIALSKVQDGDSLVPESSLKSGSVGDQKWPKNNDEGPSPTQQDTEEGNDVKMDVCDSFNQQSVDHETISGTCARASPNQSSPLKAEHMEKEELKNEANIEEGPMAVESGKHSNHVMFDTDTSGAGESGTREEQAAFIIELVKFHKERGLDFKPPKFYGEPLNLLKLWRSVLQLGGYDKVTACKYWRQVGESFKPPKTCTTISWTFRIFYEKALLDYERYRASTDGSGLAASLSLSAGADNLAPGSGRARRDAAARAMQGWHSQRILDNGEVSDPIIKDKSSMPLSKKEKPLNSLGGNLKRKKPSADTAVTVAQMKLPRTQSDATVIDIGSPADWVKINVRATRDCYEVYALVPGLLREEVRVQSDPAGRLVISGEPENPDNPWNVTPFKKVVSLPSRIDPHQTSAVVTLHGQLFVRVPFEQYE